MKIIINLKNYLIVVLLISPVYLIGQSKGHNPCIVHHKSRGNANIVTEECCFKDSNVKKSLTITKTNNTKKWNIHKRQTIWDENGKKISKTKYKSQHGGDWGVARKSITWYFVCDGKRCLKRKKTASQIRLH
jgi:hypothetical protein